MPKPSRGRSKPKKKDRTPLRVPDPPCTPKPPKRPPPPRPAGPGERLWPNPLKKGLGGF